MWNRFVPARRVVALWASGVWGAAAIAACTGADLYDLDKVPSQPNKVSFVGTVCTDNPAERSFPLKVVFVVDASPNLPLDPASPTYDQQVAQLVLQRQNAVRDAVSTLRAPDTEFALVRFGGDALLLPEGGFTPNTADIAEAAGTLAVPVPCGPDGCRRVGAAFSLAASLVSGDVLSTPRGPRSRTKYVIVMVTGGAVDDGVLSSQVTADCDEACLLEDRVAELRQFVKDGGGADFQLHILDASPLSPDAAERDAALDVYARMAASGAGEFKPICRRDENGLIAPVGCGVQNLSLLGLDIQSARNVFLKKSFIVTNVNAIHADEGARTDSDADGIADDDELATGTSAVKRDSDNDGISDRVEVLLATVGLRPTVADHPAVCAAVPTTTTDTDGDGLSDCEEMLLRLDPTLFDSDADGAPDLLEVLGGTNFLSDDTLVDADFDGATNGEELRAHTDARSADARARAELSYLYRENDLGIQDLLFATQPRDIDGVTVQDVSATSSLGNGLLIYLPGSPPHLAWKDANDEVSGGAVAIDDDGVYVLTAFVDPEEPQADPPLAPKTITVEVTTAILPSVAQDEFLRVASAERQCIDFRVRNVTLVHTQKADGRAEGMNDIRIFFGQVPGDVPGAFGIFRVAQFPFKYIPPDVKEPNVADQLVEDYRFVLFGDE